MSLKLIFQLLRPHMQVGRPADSDSAMERFRQCLVSLDRHFGKTTEEQQESRIANGCGSVVFHGRYSFQSITTAARADFREKNERRKPNVADEQAAKAARALSQIG
uniref:Uncharacterized protein n=2 Tax=Paracidobacterium acidisoli TaxID=2303751 RepID=A0A372IM46_9BACT